jgi:hypothetical protein
VSASFTSTKRQGECTACWRIVRGGEGALVVNFQSRLLARTKRTLFLCKNCWWTLGLMAPSIWEDK